MEAPKTFEEELQDLTNRHCMENDSDTPDFILAEYLADCLVAWNKATKNRTRWYRESVAPTPPVKGKD